MKSKTRKASGKASLDPLVGPCPFCGATATTVRSPSGGPMQRLQHTADCYFGGAHLFVENDDRIEPWNRRANAAGHGAAKPYPAPAFSPIQSGDGK